MKSAISILLAFNLTISYSLGQSLDELNWILGEWEMVEGPSTTTETWKVKDDSTFVGTGITMLDNKIVFQEELSIKYRNGDLSYVAILSDKTAHFLLTEFSNQTAVFEDPKNDFPSKIVYELDLENLGVTLVRIQNGEEQSMRLQFIKK
ncbi:MAG TPA: hypothetical protein DCR04_03095 [Flavobacteriales bacterium]|nr:hypothetical protein [Flavobacteriales bacterium]